jgi:hypothetical protein
VGKETTIVARSGERESTPHPFRGARLLRQGQSTGEGHQPPTGSLTAGKVSNGRMRESRSSSYRISLRFTSAAPKLVSARISASPSERARLSPLHEQVDWIRSVRRIGNDEASIRQSGAIAINAAQTHLSIPYLPSVSIPNRGR